jgi:histidine triad (HIT) family protein
MEECLYCRIIKGIIPASIVYSDEKVMAILDKEPVNPGHVEIFPKKHVAQLSELDQETGAHMFKIAMQIADALRRSGIKCEGANLLLADGKAAFQHVLHIHLHVIPRFAGDGFEIKVRRRFSLKRTRWPDDKELDEITKKIKETMH